MTKKLSMKVLMKKKYKDQIEFSRNFRIKCISMKNSML